MFKKLALATTLMIVLTSLGCVCQSGSRFGMRTCGPCGTSYECTACGVSACDPVAPCEQAGCAPCFAAGPCEQATCGCEPSACDVAACEPSACADACFSSPCDCGKGLGMRTRFGNENGLFNSFGRGGIVKQGHSVFNQAPEEMYVTRGPRDFFYDPNSSRVR